MSSRPLLSIVVPTRNREQYLRPAVTALLEMPGRDFEVVVEDNGDDAGLAVWAASLGDTRLRYRHAPGRRSMSENYDAAVGAARGEYVALIGDDDGVNPELLAAAAWAAGLGLDVVVPTTPATYTWPDLQIRGTGVPEPGELRVYPFDGRVWEPDPEEELLACARAAGQTFADLPKVYYGLVRRTLLEEVRSRTGTYFPGVSPDLAGAVAVAALHPRLRKVDYPLFLPGSAGGSNAGRSGRREHLGLLGDQPHLAPDVEDTWSEVVPRFFSVETIWAEAFISSARAMARPDLVAAFNVERLYAHCLMWHRAYARFTVPALPAALSATGRRRVPGLAGVGLSFAGFALLRAKFLVRRLLPRPAAAATGTAVVGPLPDIAAAAAALGGLLSDPGLPAMPWRPAPTRDRVGSAVS